MEYHILTALAYDSKIGLKEALLAGTVYYRNYTLCTPTTRATPSPPTFTITGCRERG